MTTQRIPHRIKTSDYNHVLITTIVGHLDTLLTRDTSRRLYNSLVLYARAEGDIVTRIRYRTNIIDRLEHTPLITQAALSRFIRALDSVNLKGKS